VLACHVTRTTTKAPRRHVATTRDHLANGVSGGEVVGAAGGVFVAVGFFGGVGDFVGVVGDVPVAVGVFVGGGPGVLGRCGDEGWFFGNVV
jgi:hypothetical protein